MEREKDISSWRIQRTGKKGRMGKREGGKEGGKEGGRERTLGGAVEDDPKLMEAAFVGYVDLEVAHHPEGRRREGGRGGRDDDD